MLNPRVVRLSVLPTQYKGSRNTPLAARSAACSFARFTRQKRNAIQAQASKILVMPLSTHRFLIHRVDSLLALPFDR
jgi:hypothetical protein